MTAAEPCLRVEEDGAVRHVVLCRPERMNVLTPQLRDELGWALRDADADPGVKVVLLRAEGRAFCAGFALDESTSAYVADAEAEAAGTRRRWDSVADLRMIGSFAATWALLHQISKPTIAAVQGWCVAGGTDMVLNADIVVAGEGATFGYPPARVWGTPEAPWVWVARLGVERAKRYLLTGDEIRAPEAARIGLVLECVPDAELHDHGRDLAHRMARLPLNQLQMHKLLVNEVAAQMYRPDSSRLLGCLMDGVARHTQEGVDWAARAQEVGFRQAVRERDAPFGDYGERPRG